MHWWIIEDALRDAQGHWLEYVKTFQAELKLLGDEVTVLGPRDVQPFVREGLDVQPVLPRSIWHRMNDGSGPLTRLARIPAHSMATYASVRSYCNRHTSPDLIFVPTMAVHHLAAWWALLNGPLRREKTRVLLYFLESPVRYHAESGGAVLLPGQLARLFRRLLRVLKPAVERGQVLLAAETQALSRALVDVTGVPFTYLPQPVRPFAVRDAARGDDEICMAAYGPARHEKGSDILQTAITKYLQERPKTRARFVLQWIDDFPNERGEWVRKSQTLANDTRVRYIGTHFAEGEYGRWLGRTDVMLLPYRQSYCLRGSRVAIEAMVHGIPVICSRGTTLAQQVEEFGALVACEDGSVESLVAAIRATEDNHTRLREQASARSEVARNYFSVANFRRILFEKLFA